MSAPLEGLRVLELATGVAGPYAGRLLAMLGAEVHKVEPPEGDPTWTYPIDGRQPVDGPGPLFVHLNAGKHRWSAGAFDLEDALGWADVVVDDRVRRDVAGSPLDPARLASLARRPVVARVTAWGFDAEVAGRLADELAVQAASGALTVTNEQYGRPVRFPGWQSQYLAGGHAAAGVLAALAGRPDDGGGGEVEVTWVGAMLTAVEGALSRHLHTASHVDVVGERPEGIRALQDGAFPSGPFRCADGHVVPGTVRPADWVNQCKLYGREDLLEDERFGWRTRMENRHELRAEIQPWYDARSKAEIFELALGGDWAAAMILTATDALDDPHLAERRFLSDVVADDGLDLPAGTRVAGRPWRVRGLVEGDPVRLAARDVDEPPAPDAAAPPRPKPLSDVRILELTWAWAGPFVGRFLGALGADVARIETGSRPDGWRSPIRWKQTGLRIPDGAGPDDRTYDASNLFNTVNRNKRSVSVDLTTAGGREAFGLLLDAADALVVNMTASVLADRDIEDAVHAAVERGLVAVTLPAVGATGPYRMMPGYGALTEGMGGFGARFGPDTDEAGISTSYYPDCVAGIHATVAVLSGLARADATGAGSFVDLSQQETMWMHLGEDLALASMEGRDPARLGNTEPGAAASGIVRTADDEWIAVVAPAGSTLPDDLDGWAAERKADDAVAEARSAGATAERLVDFERGWSEGVFADRGLLDEVAHPVTGVRSYLAVPVVIDGRRVATRSAAPCFAVHTDDVLRDWAAVDDDQLAAWRADDAVGTIPAKHVPGR